MRRWIIYMLLTICGLVATDRVHAQYYSWGADPTSFNWRQIKGNKYRVVYPDTARHVATEMCYYLDAVSKDISYGYRHPQMSIPFVVHPANMRSNGLVMWLPKRIEFLSTPSIDSYSMPWTKQLVAHEYRHAVQYNNLNRGIVKILSYVLGQQSSTIGLLFMPLWMMEGDAVMTETEMSTFGRGKQPSFSLAYRAYGNIATLTNNRDKWFCGSYRDFVPDHYQLGYFMCRHGYDTYGAVLGNDMAAILARRPYMVVSNSWIFKKLYGISQDKLFTDTFTRLHDHWQSFPQEKQTSEYIPLPEPRSYTTYAFPMPTNDGRIIYLKEDFDSTSAFMIVDTLTKSEQRLARTGMISSRPALSSTGVLWWTEYRRSPLFEQKVTSRLYMLDTKSHHVSSMPNDNSILYPTPTDGHDIAWVEYTIDGRYHVAIKGDSPIGNYIDIERGKEVHGMAWDNLTQALYLIITDDDGMHIARLTAKGTTKVTQPAYTTLSNLRAKDGKLYFGSIASGRDEMHYYDLTSSKEYRISTSTYGSFHPAPYDENHVVGTSYDRRGYVPVLQRMDKAVEVEHTPHANPYLLPESKPWGVVNLDTLRFDNIKADSLTRSRSSRRFSRVGHALNIHSWAPASYNPYEITEESKIAFNLGATIMSQNILSTAEGFLTWGWNRDEGSIYKGMIRYYGLGINLWARGTYGGTQTIHTVYVYNSETGKLEYPDTPKRDKYYSIGAGATLPLLFNRGYHTSQLSLSASWNYSNGLTARVNKIDIAGGKLANFKTIGYSEGIHQLSFGVSFSDQVRMAYRDFQPPWAVVLSANYALSPTTDDFGHLPVLYGKVYTPGFGPHHSLSVAATYLTPIGGFHSDLMLSDMSFKSTPLLPRGFSSYTVTNKGYMNYMATSVNYQMPVWYPDGGLSGIIYFKRLRLNLGGDFASYQKPIIDAQTGDITKAWHRMWAYGGDIIVDFNLFSLPQSATITARLSLYGKGANFQLRKRDKFYISAGLGLPF